MQNLSFTPQQSRSSAGEDAVASALTKIARNILVVVLGLSPLFFVPASYAPFNFSKILFVILGVFLAIIFYGLGSLRMGKISFKLSGGVLAVWVLAVVTALAAVFSGDIRDSFLGDAFGIHTAIFVGVIALIVSVVSILKEQKTSIMHLYMLLTASALVVGFFHVVRILFGPNILTLGVFSGATSTPLGGWNDLGLFFGLSILLALVAIEQFPLTKIGKVLFGVVAVFSLIILGVVNFAGVWVLLGIISLIVLLYSLTKNRFGQASSDTDSDNTMASIILSVAVFIVSLVFVVGGSSVGQMVTNMTGVSYVEVRPSFEATFAIARDVYSENAFFGTGPNKFADAWRQYKDPAINQTIFWKTPFEAGVGYIPTFAITTGIFGILAWFGFLFFVLRAGVRVLFMSQNTDRFWYFVGASSFVSALYLWGMSIVYVPGPTIIILAAAFTGILFAAQSVGVQERAITLSATGGKRHAFSMVALSIVVIVGSVGSMYLASRHYSGLLTFNQAIASIRAGEQIDEIERQISKSYSISGNDRFAREIVGLQLQKMSSMLGLQNPTDAQRQQFQSIVVNAVNAGQLAVDADPTDPLNWQSLGSVYSLLASGGVEGSLERGRDAFNTALLYDPRNPEIKLLLAQLESRSGNLDVARDLAFEAIRLKPNYTDAYYFISQIEIARGDVDSAIATTRESITLEPRNQARYYQLGVLYISQGMTAEAIQAFEAAITIDPDYANARYFLALSYDSVGRKEDAKAQLERVLELNPGNADVTELLARLGRGESLSQSVSVPEQVSEVEPLLGEDGEILTPNDPDSPLLSPVNIVPESAENEEVFESETLDEATSEEEVVSDENFSEGE